jgi:hypothetical protein
MRGLLCGLAGLVVFASAAGADEGKGEKKEGRPAARSVVVPQDTTPFKVRQADTVRLTGTGIAGSQIEAKVEGPARVVAVNIVSERSRGRRRVLGGNTEEFEVTPTGPGKVTVTLTVTPPRPDAQPRKTAFAFEVE